jgi:hypothetical protein
MFQIDTKRPFRELPHGEIIHPVRCTRLPALAGDGLRHARPRSNLPASTLIAARTAVYTLNMSTPGPS